MFYFLFSFLFACWLFVCLGYVLLASMLNFHHCKPLICPTLRAMLILSVGGRTTVLCSIVRKKKQTIKKNKKIKQFIFAFFSVLISLSSCSFWFQMKNKQALSMDFMNIMLILKLLHLTAEINMMNGNWMTYVKTRSMLVWPLVRFWALVSSFSEW